jgi:hypothetical protein
MTHPYFEQIKRMKLQEPPSPWKISRFHEIHALQDIGYAPDSDQLLIVSNSSREVLDCVTGQILAQDESDSGQWEFDRVHLSIRGIGPLENKTIRLAGKHGGGLPSYTRDDWRLDCVPLEWPSSTVILVPPPKASDPLMAILTYNPFNLEGATRIAPGMTETVIAFGFSETGNSFVVAATSFLEIFSRHYSVTL